MAGSGAAARRPHTSWRDQYLAHPRQGPMPALLLLLTVATGMIDAVSILTLGRVFIANMTGNVVFVGFALAGAPGFSLTASLIALVGFLIGAGLGGRFVGRLRTRRGRLLAVTTTVELPLLCLAFVIALVAGQPFGPTSRSLIVLTAAVALGLQNEATRELAVPDITTTVLTRTLTGLAAELRNGNAEAVVRRLLAVAAMLGGALGGALLVLHASAIWGLGVALVVVAVVCAGAWAAQRQSGSWQSPAH